MKALLLVAMALAACAPPVAAVEPSSTKPLPWCMRVMVNSNGQRTLLAACAADLRTCEALRTIARQSGGLVGLEAVGACR